MPALNTKAWLVSALIILFCGALIGLSGQQDLPLDGHEVLVAETAKQMQTRQDWILPWFNAEPRLNKPPLSYWATAAVATLWGELESIEAHHARAVSIIAAILILLTLIHMGQVLGDAQTGLLAAGLFTTTVGYFSYSHDARPDMLYAALCTLALNQFIISESQSGSTRHLLLMWTAFALASLTKGPHLPAMLLLAITAHLLLDPRKRVTVRSRLQPLSGLLLFTLIVSPWFILLVDRTDAIALGNSQLAGSLLVPSLSNALDPYYFFDALLLLAPWVFLAIIGAGIALRRKRLEPTERLLLLCWLVPAVCLSFGPQKRWFYLLPALPALCLWMAITLRGLSARSAYAFWLSHCAGLTLVALYVLSQAPDQALPWAGVLMLATGLVLLILRGRETQSISWRLQVFVIAAVAMFSAGVAQSPLPWSADRYNKYELAQIIRKVRNNAEPVYALRVNPAVFVHYARTNIPRYTGVTQISLPANSSALVLCPARTITELGDSYLVTELASISHGDHGRTVLARLTSETR